MSSNSKLSLLLRQSSLTIADLHRKSADWFVGKAREFSTVKALREETLMRGDQGNKSATVEPGSLYLYVYEAKHAKKLPYWDRFPLVFPFRATQHGFYGLNLHYLPYAARAQLLQQLISATTGSTLSADTKLRIRWQTISAFSQFAPAQVCVKQYLFSQLRSPFKKIDPEDWVSALFLPMERFQSASSSQVWSDSIRKLKALK